MFGLLMGFSTKSGIRLGKCTGSLTSSISVSLIRIEVCHETSLVWISVGDEVSY